VHELRGVAGAYRAYVLNLVADGIQQLLVAVECLAIPADVDRQLA
jgi:hypothetical protein